MMKDRAMCLLPFLVIVLSAVAGAMLDRHILASNEKEVVPQSDYVCIETQPYLNRNEIINQCGKMVQR